MPQGNDTAAHEAFKSSMESQYGPFANAEELIQTHAAGIDPSLRRTGLTQIDPQATEKLREEGLDKVAKKFKDAPQDAELVDFAVRGNALVGVFMDANGNYSKEVTGANDRFKPDAGVSGDSALLRAQARADARVRAETQRLQAEAEERIAEARAEENQRVAAEVAKIREQADADVAKAQDTGEKGASRTKKESKAENTGTGGGSAARAGGAGEADTKS